MNYLDLCSGISAPTVAWRPLGWKALAYAEIERFPSAVLKHHYPQVENVGDFTRIGGNDYAADLVVAGTPCQDFSIAGLRAGLDGKRGQLTIEFARFLERARPRWFLWENVPGVLSTDKGRAFGLFLWLLGQCGYGLAYRVLNAQYAGVPQRRRRVFLVGHLGDWRRAAAVLFDRESMQGYPPPSREAGQAVAALTAHGVGTCGADDSQAQAKHLLPVPPGVRLRGSRCGTCIGEFGMPDSQFAPAAESELSGSRLVAFGGNNTSGPIDVATAVNACSTASGRQDFESETFIAHSLPVAFDTTQITSRENRCDPQPGDPCHPLTANGHPPAAAFRTSANCGAWETGDRTDALTTGTDRSQHLIATQWAVRRLTARECERLQGFPDDYTLIPQSRYGLKAAHRMADALRYLRTAKIELPDGSILDGEILSPRELWHLAPDGPRYKALGNSMAVPDLTYMGLRIQAIDQVEVLK